MGAQKQRLELTWYNKTQALIPTSQGKYGYTWVHPQDPRYCETHTIQPGKRIFGTQQPKVPENLYSTLADLPPTNENLLILGESGDVLEALTKVPELAEKYVGQVKCIYIDPPFNTQQAFPSASYEDNLEHSIWLTMMRDRLQHMRRLLSKDGSIWVHLDEVENHRMRSLLDEVFGSGNFIAEVIWKNGVHVRNDAKGFSSNHDTILVYSRGKFDLNKLPATDEMSDRFSSPDGDPREWQSIASSAPGAKTHQGMVFGVQHPVSGEILYPPSGSCWRLSQNNFLEIMRGWGNYELLEIDDMEKRAEICGVTPELVRAEVKALMLAEPLEFARPAALLVHKNGPWPELFFTGQDGRGGIRKKGYMPEEYGRVPHTVWDDSGRNDQAKREIQTLFNQSQTFATPKPEVLLERIIHLSTNPGDLVLDVFAGSGTTAAVAHKMGRRWITCELLDDTFNRYTLPRLTKVVQGEDLGGITSTSGERVDATVEGLPEAMTAEEAQKLTSLLNKAIKDQPELKKSIDIKTLKSLIKTKRSPDVMNWRGGGGFQVAHLSPACFDYSPELGLTTLTNAASDLEVLTGSVAAQLGFHLTPTHELFHGMKGAMRLYVTRTPLTPELVTEIAGQLDEGERVTIASTVVLDESRKSLREASKGSRIIHIPNDLFRFDEEVSN